MLLSKTLPFLAVGLTLSVGFGCAHNQAAPTTLAAPAPVAAAPAKDGNGDDTNPALTATLTGAVAHFDFDRDQLNADASTRLQRVADALKSHPKAQVRISGHCDELGTEEYNLALGQRRAEVAKKYLVALGVDATRIDTISYGEERPLDPAHSDAAYAKNRRDEVEPLKK